MHTLLLASQSPRRRELLRRAGFEFDVASVQISEIPDENLNLQDQIRDLARQKAEALATSLERTGGLERRLLLAADTVVVVEGDEILGKPRDLKQSAEHLRRLSGRTHRVITAICLWELASTDVRLAHEWSEVTFHRLDEGQIESYVAGGEGLDKAGAYGAQSAEGSALIARIDGALDNVIGLPVALVERMLNENGWIIARR